MDTKERIIEKEEEKIRMLNSEMKKIYAELERNREEERQRLIGELKLTRNEKAKIFRKKKGNVEMQIIMMKNEIEEFEERRKRENEYFLERLQEIPEEELLENQEDVLCFRPEDVEEQVKEFSTLLKFSLDLYKFIKWSSKGIEDTRCNEDYFDHIKLLNFFNSHFDRDFEKELKYYKEKFILYN